MTDIINKKPVINIEVSRGDDYTLQATFKNPDGTVINLTSYTGVWELRRDEKAVSADSTITATLGGALGTFSATISDSFTLANPGRFYYKVKLTTGSTTETKFKGVLNIV
jgi:hypothetical protein